MATLEGPQYGPASGGKPDSLVLLLHGVGADGFDLIDLAPVWAEVLPNALFIAPHAPFPFQGAPFGRQWFDIMDRTPARLEAGLRHAAGILGDFTRAKLAELDLGGDRLALMGFSQGAMVALFAGLRGAVPAPACILAYSGALLAPESFAAEVTSRPPVLLVHGEADEVVPAMASRQAARALQAEAVPHELLLRPELGHGLDDAGLAAGTALLARSLPRIAGG
ncbi:MAG: prolyl oligopeptidase family serine peptidase [Roseomonas sp.]|nr:prolyl oligopeptidase family serine peptidase [Roseomonas sp.]MCA3387078.1 prolyl oligopeptidase family serine peptidase [Roseomonas sp.]MCA3408360.1 prolyl oligopeptidase family serine peptidase [Roseomonas sp.]